MSGLGLRFDMHQRMDQKLVLAPRMIQSMEILQLPIADLLAKIAKELQENPFLEQKEKHGEQDAAPAEFDPDSTPLKHDETGDLEFSRLDELNRDWDNHFNEEHRVSRGAMEEEGRPQTRRDGQHADAPAIAPGLPGRTTRRDGTGRRAASTGPAHLQLRRPHRLPRRPRAGQRGFRREDTFRYMTLEEIAAAYDLDAPLEDVEDTLLHVVQKLDPPGVGARSAKECLLLQIGPETPHKDVLRVLIRDHLEDVAYNRIPVIQKATKFDIPTIQDAIESLHHNLVAAPGLKYADAETQYVMPDVIVERTDDDDYSVRLTDEWVPKIRISQRTVDLLKNKELDEKVKEELRKKLQSADWLVKAVEQRRNTLLKVTRAIIDHQKEFLDAGPEHIHPLKMQQIADQVKVHVTTVSRAVDDKWVQTPRGVFPLKRFFGGGKKNDQTNEDVAYEVMKQKLLELVSDENKASPFSDEELVTKLNDAGYPVARRTVTKYRKMLKIPSSRQRKDWSRAR